MQENTYSLSDNLNQIIDIVPEEQKDEIKRRLDFDIAQYLKLKERNNSESVAYNYLLHIDNIIQESVKRDGQDISCKKGCSNCCKINVDISKEEAILILEWCKERNIDIDWQKLMIQTRFDFKTYFEIPEEQRACTFLSKEGTCKIYEIRPIGCRKMFSQDDPNKCDLNNGKQKIKRYVVPLAEITACAIMSCTEFKSLPTLLLKYKDQVYGDTNNKT